MLKRALQTTLLLAQVVAASNLALLFIYTSTGSTSAIGFFVLPPAGWLMVMVVLTAEWLFRRPWNF